MGDVLKYLNSFRGTNPPKLSPLESDAEFRFRLGAFPPSHANGRFRDAEESRRVSAL